MLEYLKQILYDLRYNENVSNIENRVQKAFALENAIESLEDLKYKERSEKNGGKIK